MVITYIYWLSTILLAILYLASALIYIIKKEWVTKTILEFGYPSYLVPLLTILKVLAVVTILSRINIPLSDLAYAGMLFHLMFSALAHIGIRKSKGAIPALLGLILLILSFSTQNIARDFPSPYGFIPTKVTIDNT